LKGFQRIFLQFDQTYAIPKVGSTLKKTTAKKKKKKKKKMALHHSQASHLPG